MNRDIEYEENNIAYDEQHPEDGDGGIKCMNYELCETVLPKWWYDCKACYICTNCDMFFGLVLDFIATQECVICGETKIHVKFPAQCGHSFCVSCSRNIIFGPGEDHYSLSTIPYGGPPCPDGHINPVKGPQYLRQW